MMLAALLLLQATVVQPAYSPPLPALPTPHPSTLALVLADTIDQTDPRRRCAEPGCTAMFLVRFENARTLAGTPFASAFAARMELGSPFSTRYRLLLIVQHRAGEEPLVLASAGFNERTGRACLERRDTARLEWAPAGPAVSVANGEICAEE